jgi:hypothetical protein
MGTTRKEHDFHLGRAGQYLCPAHVRVRLLGMRWATHVAKKNVASAIRSNLLVCIVISLELARNAFSCEFSPDLTPLPAGGGVNSPILEARALAGENRPGHYRSGTPQKSIRGLFLMQRIVKRDAEGHQYPYR